MRMNAYGRVSSVMTGGIWREIHASPRIWAIVRPWSGSTLTGPMSMKFATFATTSRSRLRRSGCFL